MSDVLISIIGGSCGAAVVSGLFGLIVWRLNRNAAKADKADAEADKAAETLSNVVAGMRLLFYVEVRRECKQHLRDGSITTEDLKELMDMHRFYHDDLGGNGFLDALISKVKKLPVIDDCGYKNEEE